MFSYSDSTEVLPSLTFTRAELVFALTRLLNGIGDNDNSTRIEMVELRHYLNLVKEDVDRASRSGELSLSNNLQDKGNQSNQTDAKSKKVPSMDELKRQFPSLTEAEIMSVIEKAREDTAKEDEKKRKEKGEVKPPPSFIAKSEVEINPQPVNAVLSEKEKKDKEDSKKFAGMLGGGL